MKKTLYIFQSGELKRKDNTLELQTENGKKVLPINTISEIHVFGELTINKRALEFLTSNKIPVHFYNRYDFYVGTYYPREFVNSGLITIKQVEFYLNTKERLYLAKSFILGAVNNIIKNLTYYKRNKPEPMEQAIKSVLEISKKLASCESANEIMAIEGQVRKIYYNAFNDILSNENFYFEERTKRPPESPINALISFGNSLLYTTVLSQIYRTHLDPRISYLHEPNQRSFNLNLDIAEVFKPVIVDRIIFSLINKRQISLKHFEEGLDYSYLNEEGSKIFVQEFEKKLLTTIKYKNIGNVSYRRLIRIECYKLYKHFFREEIYNPFLSEW
jgi:CRISPR-associated protein Cas1